MPCTGGHHFNFVLIHIPYIKASLFDRNSIEPPAHDILQQDLAYVLAHDGLAIMAGKFNAALAQLLVPAKMRSATC